MAPGEKRENLFEEKKDKNFPYLGKKQTSRSKKHRVSCNKQDEPQEVHSMTHYNWSGPPPKKKETREKKLITCKETSIRLSADFVAETLQARKENIFKVKKGKNL